MPVESEPCAPKVKSNSLRTLCGFPRNRLQIGWPQEHLGAEFRQGYSEYKVILRGDQGRMQL